MHMTVALDKELLSVKGIKDINEPIIFLKKRELKDLELEKGKYYIVCIDSSDTSNDIIETTRVNWNGGQYLKSRYLKCEPVNIQGLMVQINACGYDPETKTDLQDIYLNFWINKNIITILECIS